MADEEKVLNDDEMEEEMEEESHVMAEPSEPLVDEETKSFEEEPTMPEPVRKPRSVEVQDKTALDNHPTMKRKLNSVIQQKSHAARKYFTSK